MTLSKARVHEVKCRSRLSVGDSAKCFSVPWHQNPSGTLEIGSQKSHLVKMARVVSRASFLKDAAYLLSARAPAASATIGAARIKLLETDELESTKFSAKDEEAMRRETCGACGNLMVPGWSCSITQVPHQTGTGTSKKQKLGQPRRHETDIIYTCLRCNRETKQPLSWKNPARISKTKNKRITTADSAARRDGSQREDAAKVVKSVNASSKQRAKARKGGLQALLSQSKTQDKSKGLDLMDFMQ